MTLELDTSYVEAGQAKLIHALQKPLLQALLGCWLEGVQALELALWQLYRAHFIHVATGAALDQLGAAVGQPRENRTDAVYRAWIAARVFINRSAGTPGDSLAVLGFVEADAAAVLTEYPPASYVVSVGSLSTLDGTQLFALLTQVRPVGVQLFVVWSALDSAHLFALGDAALPAVFDADTGLGDTNSAAIGGAFTGVAA